MDLNSVAVKNCLTKIEDPDLRREFLRDVLNGKYVEWHIYRIEYGKLQKTPFNFQPKIKRVGSTSAGNSKLKATKKPSPLHGTFSKNMPLKKKINQILNSEMDIKDKADFIKAALERENYFKELSKWQN